MSTARPSYLHRLTARLPRFVHPAMAWLQRPEARWVRIPVGALLVVAGVFGFLPVLGFWMVPLGALLLAEDFPGVRRLTVHMLDGVESLWERFRRHRSIRNQS
jgi:hypothetical protein